MMTAQELERTVQALTSPGKGLLAADESFGTIEKRFKEVNVPSTEETRRDYREMLFTTPELNAFISGVILFEETLRQKSADGMLLPHLLMEQRIIPGIKVDKGTMALPGFPDEKVTQGLDGLAERVAEYKKLGARFAKWRAVFPIGQHVPTPQGIAVNAAGLAHYAAVCQQQGVVPIVEPEVLMDGDHDIETCARVTEEVLHAVFHALHRQRVIFEFILLKPNMVLPGLAHPRPAAPEVVAAATLTCLRRTVPPAVAGINFLSGGQPYEAVTANLNAMNAGGAKTPWPLSFSYARALQAPALDAWRGMAVNKAAAQRIFAKRARLNSAASLGRYNSAMEQD